MTKAERTARLIDQARARFGLTAQDTMTLIRAEKTLQRWAEQECGDGNAWASWSIERDEETDIPYRCVYPHLSGSPTRTKIRDTETITKRQVERLLAKYPGVTAMYQGDPRGCALHLCKTEDAQRDPHNYSMYGLAVGV